MGEFNILSDLVEEFLGYLKLVKKASDNTCNAYKRDLEKLELYASSRGITDVKGITEDILGDYINKLRDEHFAASTIGRHICSIRAFYRFAIENGNINRDVTEFLQAPKVEKSEPKILTETEVDDLLSKPDDTTIKGIRDKAMLELMYATGIRVSELISICIYDIDFRFDVLTVRTSKGQRIIPYGRKAKEALKHYLELSRPYLVVNDTEELLFVNYKGEALSRQGFWKMMKTYVRKAGISEDITPDILRNSFAAHMVENGADLDTLREMLGHTYITSTARYVGGKNNKLREVYNRAHVRG